MAGEIFGQISGVTDTSLSPTDPLVAFVINTTSLVTATEVGLFSSTASSWLLPGAIGATTLTTESIDVIALGEQVGGAGSNLSLGLIDGTNGIPEPSSGILVLLASLTLLGRRAR